MLNSILAVDDDPVCLMSLELLLIDACKEVVTQDCGKKALDYLNKTSTLPELIFLDLMMPNMHGNDVIKFIKQNPKIKDIPIIVLTGTYSEDILKNSIEYGAKKVIKKPYTADDLMNAIKDVI